MARDITAPPQAPTAWTSLATDITGMDGEIAHAAEARDKHQQARIQRRLATETVRDGPIEWLAERVSQKKRDHRH